MDEGVDGDESVKHGVVVVFMMVAVGMEMMVEVMEVVWDC